MFFCLSDNTYKLMFNELWHIHINQLIPWTEHDGFCLMYKWQTDSKYVMLVGRYIWKCKLGRKYVRMEHCYMNVEFLFECELLVSFSHLLWQVNVTLPHRHSRWQVYNKQGLQMASSVWNQLGAHRDPAKDDPASEAWLRNL